MTLKLIIHYSAEILSVLFAIACICGALYAAFKEPKSEATLHDPQYQDEDDHPQLLLPRQDARNQGAPSARR